MGAYTTKQMPKVNQTDCIQIAPVWSCVCVYIIRLYIFVCCYVYLACSWEAFHFAHVLLGPKNLWPFVAVYIYVFSYVNYMHSNCRPLIGKNQFT